MDRPWPFIRGFLLPLSASCVLMLCMVAGLNYIVDPRAEFPTHAFRPLVATDAAHKVVHFAAIDRVDVLILGDSRVMSIAPEDLDVPSFNFGISGGTLADAEAILSYAFDVHPEITDVIIGVDPIQLAPGRANTPGVLENPELATHARTPEGVGSLSARLMRSLRWDYVEDTVNSLWYSVAGYPETDFEILPDGFRIVHSREEMLADPTFDIDVYAGVALAPAAADFAAIPAADEVERARLARMVLHAAEAGARAHLFVGPLQPSFARHLDGTAYEVRLAETVVSLRSLCGPGVSIHDLSTPERFGGDARGFYDGWHPDRTNSARIARLVLSGADDCLSPDARP